MLQEHTQPPCQNTRREQLKRVTASILDPLTSVHSLRPSIIELAALLADSQTHQISQPSQISDGETHTPNGVAVSPTMAMMCLDDFVRTITFIRGTHAAIGDLRKRFPDRPVRVFYVGCGPWATLAVPLMSLVSSTEAVFTLLDIHPEAIESAKSIVEELGLAESIEKFVVEDAGSCRIDPDQPPDVILMEIMRACLESEPQVAITRYLLNQAPHAVLVPEEVSVDLSLVDVSREFSLDSLEQNRDPVVRDRIPLGSVFLLNTETVNSWHLESSDQLPGSTVQIPDPLEERYQAMLFTVIRVYQNHVLQDYNSGLTSPLLLSVPGGIRPGDSLRFVYELGRRPRLIAEVCPTSHACKVSMSDTPS